MIEHVTFDDIVRWQATGYQGTTTQHHIEGVVLNDEHELTDFYTVYWPKDSIRVIPGSTFAVARTVFALLRDPRTRHMGNPTADRPAEIALVRRDLARPNEWATFSQVDNDTVYAKDRLLPGDISANVGWAPTQLSAPGVTYRLDLATLPDL